MALSGHLIHSMASDCVYCIKNDQRTLSEAPAPPGAIILRVYEQNKVEENRVPMNMAK